MSFHILRSSCNGWDPDRKTASSVPAVIAILYIRCSTTRMPERVGHTSTISYILGMFNLCGKILQNFNSLPVAVLQRLGAPGAQAQFLESEAFSYPQHLSLAMFGQLTAGFDGKSGDQKSGRSPHGDLSHGVHHDAFPKHDHNLGCLGVE